MAELTGGERPVPRLYSFLRSVLPPIMKPYFPLRIHGLENLPRSGGAVLASNHLSFIDSIVMPISVNRPIFFLGKSEYFDSWKTRWFFAGTGVVPVYRQGGDKGMESMNTGMDILRGGDFLGIYPEGTRSPDGRLYRGKTGPVRMAIETGSPIVPCAVHGTDLAMPTGSYLPKRHGIDVHFGRPLDFTRYADRSDDPFVLRSATDELMYEIMMLSHQEYVDEYAGRIKSGDVKLGEDGPSEAPAAAAGPDQPGGDVQDIRRAS